MFNYDEEKQFYLKPLYNKNIINCKDLFHFYQNCM